MSNFYSQSTPFENGGQQQQPSGRGVGPYGNQTGAGGSSGYGEQQQGYGTYATSTGTTGGESSGYGGYGGYAAGQQQHQQQQQQQQPSWKQQGWQPQNTPPLAPAAAAAPLQQAQQQQQQQQQQSSIFNPAATAVMAAAASGSNDAMVKAATTVGQQFFNAGTAKVIPGFESAMQKLRVYFAVDNRYVKSKMQRILFPFLRKEWRRVVSTLWERSTDVLSVPSIASPQLIAYIFILSDSFTYSPLISQHHSRLLPKYIILYIYIYIYIQLIRSKMTWGRRSQIRQ